MRENALGADKSPHENREGIGIDARDVLAGEYDDTTVWQAVEVGDVL